MSIEDRDWYRETTKKKSVGIALILAQIIPRNEKTDRLPAAIPRMRLSWSLAAAPDVETPFKSGC